MSQPTNGRDEPIGASALQAPEKKRGLPAWLIPLALAIVAVLAVLLLLSRCGESDSGGTAAATSSAPTTSATSAPSPSPGTGTGTGDGTGGGSGTVTVDGKTMLPLSGDADASLATYADQDAAATSVQVQSVPADEGFWVGSSDSDRVWVQLTGKAGESPYKVKTGDMVTFTGTVAKNPSGFADKIGVTAPEGKSQLTGQKYHITAAKSALKLAN